METRRKPPIAGKRGKRSRRNGRGKKKRKIKNKKTCPKRRKGGWGGREGKQCYRFAEEEGGREYARAEYLKRELS